MRIKNIFPAAITVVNLAVSGCNSERKAVNSDAGLGESCPELRVVGTLNCRVRDLSRSGSMADEERVIDDKKWFIEGTKNEIEAIESHLDPQNRLSRSTSPQTIERVLEANISKSFDIKNVKMYTWGNNNKKCTAWFLSFSDDTTALLVQQQRVGP